MLAEPEKGCQIRCPKLGIEVTFAYCLVEQGSLPCSRVIRCWQGRIAVEAYLQERLSRDEWNACFNQMPQDKVTTLVELIEAARQRKGSSSNS
jgi:hypothetical protein